MGTLNDPWIYGIHQTGWFEPNHDHSAKLIGVVGRRGFFESARM